MSSWSRPHYRGAGGSPRLWYKVHGVFDGVPEISESAHRTRGVPDCVDLMRYDRERHPEVMDFGLDGAFARSLDGDRRAAVAAAPHARVADLPDGASITVTIADD
jgi:hypothetical protein